MLRDLFDEFSEHKVPYEKIDYGKALTRWIVKHAPEDLSEVEKLLVEVLDADIVED